MHVTPKEVSVLLDNQEDAIWYEKKRAISEIQKILSSYIVDTKYDHKASSLSWHTSETYNKPSTKNFF